MFFGERRECLGVVDYEAWLDQFRLDEGLEHLILQARP